MIKFKSHIFKYFIVGASGQIFDYVLTIILFSLSNNLFFSNAIGYFLGSIFTYIGHTKYTFKNNSKRLLSLRQLSYYIFACLSGVISGYLILKTLMFFGIILNLAKFFQLFIIAIVQFLVNSRLTFAKNK